MPDRTLRYVLTAEDKGASAAMQRAATVGEQAASRIGGAFSKVGGTIGGELGQVLDQIGSGFDQLGEHGLSAGAKLTLMGAGVTTLGVSLMQLGSNEKQATDQLKAAIESTGNSYSDFSDQIEKTIKHQENFGHSAADTDEALRKLTTATQDPQKALNLMAITADLAASKHISLADASTMVSRILSGSAGKVLAQYGLTMQKNADGTKNVDGTLAALGDRLKGQASASMDNFSGRVDVAFTKLHDWAAEMGQKFGPAITAVGVGVTAAGTVLQLYQARAAAAAAANAELAVSEDAVVVASSGFAAGLISTLGPIGLMVGGGIALKAVLSGLGVDIPKAAIDINALSKAGTNGSFGMSDIATALTAQLTPAMNDLHSSTGPAVDQLIRATLVSKPLTGALDGTGQSVDNVTQMLSSSPSAWNMWITGLQKSMDASGKNKAVVDFQVGSIKALRQAWQDAADAADGSTAAIQSQDEFLKANKLTVESATKKYDDAVAAAYSFTAQLGYMSKALDTLSNNQITAANQQDQLNLSMGTAADKFAGSRAQVVAHGKALEGNTDDAIQNRIWVRDQILAINAQALSYAKSTGSIGKGTDSLHSNEAALRTSLVQAGFTRAEIDRLIGRYEAVPGSVKTSVAEQGAAAVQASLQDLEYWLHRIADPSWAAHIDIIAGANAAQGGHPAAAGGLLMGPGGPTSDNLLIAASPGEYVVNAGATAQYLPFLDSINNANRIKAYAAGGLVGHLNLSEAAAIHVNIAAAEQKARNAAAAAMIASGGIPGGSGPASPGVAALQDYAFSLFRYYGWDQSQLGSLIALWNGESGWNPYAYNASSGATGIPQSLPASKMASAGADYLTNGATQIRWGENYISQVYGSPSAAYGAWLSRSPHWYGEGMPPTLFNKRTLIGVGDSGPETVSVSRGDTRSKVQTVRLDEYSLRAIAEQVVVMDGEKVAQLITKRQRDYAVRGGRR